MSLISLYNEFMEYQVAIGNSTATVNYYGYCLRPFVKYYGNEFEVNDFNRDSIRKYAVYLRNRDISSNSVKTYSKGVKVFLSWLYNEGQTKENISLYYKLPKAKRKVIDVLNNDEIESLFRFFDCSKILGLRNYCICALMYDCGLRKSEISKLKIKKIYFNENYIIVNGKGNKERIVPMSNSLKSVLLEYYDKLNIKNIKGYLFLNKKGVPITNSCIDALFKVLKKQLNIPRIHAHLLRHTFATNYLINGGDIYKLKEILGHSDLDMVLVYLHIAESQKLKHFNEYSPFDKLKRMV